MIKAHFSDMAGGIILAADVDTLDRLRSLLDIANGVSDVVAIKLGFSLALRFGLPSLVQIIKDRSEMIIIYDHQKAGTDIPQMGKPFSATCSEAGIDALIFFPLAGPETLEGFVAGAMYYNLMPIVGLVMTHGAFLESEAGYIRNDAPLLIAKKAINLGVTTYVLPGTKPEIIQEYAKGPLAELEHAAIMTPGIGSQGGAIRAAYDAAKPHRHFPIIGSAIYGAPDPRQALDGFLKEIA